MDIIVSHMINKILFSELTEKIYYYCFTPKSIEFKNEMYSLHLFYKLCHHFKTIHDDDETLMTYYLFWFKHYLVLFIKYNTQTEIKYKINNKFINKLKHVWLLLSNDDQQTFFKQYIN
jgi:hypothetical protein